MNSYENVKYLTFYVFDSYNMMGIDLNNYPCQDKAYNLDDGLIASIKDISLKESWFNNKNKIIVDYLDVEYLKLV
jgi:hypothetical protein